MCTILSLSGSPKVLLIPGSSYARVENVEVWDRTMLVSFLAQTCTIPLCMKERAYRIFILLSANVLSCIMMVIWTDQTNCSALSLLPSKLSGSAALAFQDEWLPVSMFIRMACTTADMALATASGDNVVKIVVSGIIWVELDLLRR